jgi:hypothetical protein
MADSNHPDAQTQDSEEHKKSFKRSWKSSGPVAKLTVVFAGIAAMSTTIYAIFAGGQLLVMRGQLDEMSVARRPWVGLYGELQMTRPPNFRVQEPIEWPAEFAKAHPDIANAKPLIYMEVYASWAMQNFGASPARRVNHTLLAYGSQDANKPPAEVVDMPCKVGNQMNNDPAVGAPVMFPGNMVPIPETNAITTLPDKGILGLWLVGCITYEDTSGTIHHTKILWASDLSNAPKRELALENPPIWWTPFTKFRLVESDVDQ